VSLTESERGPVTRYTMKHPICLAAALLLGVVAAHAGPPHPLRFDPVGVYATGVYDRSSAEVPAYHAASRRLFVVNATRGVDVVDLHDPARPRLVGTLGGPGVNSVATYGRLAAWVHEGPTADRPGRVTVVDAATLEPLATVATGPQPDMLCFSPDGRTLAVANEAEPRGGHDAAGGVTLIDTRFFTSRTLDFTAAIAREGTADLRLPPPDDPARDPARDVEPEYLTFTSDGRTLVVGLQENNAVALIDVAQGSVTGFAGLGWVDHLAPGSGLDASDRDGGIHIVGAPVRGLRQPDAIAVHADGEHLFLITANEGDPRTDGFDETRVADLRLDPAAFPPAAGWARPERLGRLKVSNTDGDADGDGDFDALYAFGGRSFSVFALDPRGDGGALLRPVFDSGDAFERLTAALVPAGFNAGGGDADSRSDDRGPEPEGLALGTVAGRSYLFVGLERSGGVTAWDLTDPARPVLAGYANVQDLTQKPELGRGASNPAAGDAAPEGLCLISEADSPSGEPLLVVANEVSGTVRIYAVRPGVPPAGSPR